MINRLFYILILCFSFCLSTMSQTKNFIDQPYIEVVGNFDTLVTPNLIYIKIIISEKDTRDRISLEEQESKMIKAFKNLGINTEQDLTTNDMISNYKFYLFKQKDILKTKEYILKVTSAETASKVFLQLEVLGISNTSIDRVDHSDIDNLKNIYRIKAMENSRDKAIALTKSIAQTIGNAIFISDNESQYENRLQGQVAGLKVRGVASLDMANYEPPKIEFEKIKVNASVSVKYLLK